MAAVNEPPIDPVRVRRARVARYASIGQRIGYSLFLVADTIQREGLPAYQPRGIVAAALLLAAPARAAEPKVVADVDRREADSLRERARALKAGHTGVVKIGATPPMIETVVTVQASATQVLQTNDARASVGDMSATSERYLVNPIRARILPAGGAINEMVLGQPQPVAVPK